MTQFPPVHMYKDLEPGAILLHVACLAVVWLVIRSIHRLWFHPLRNIPGPRLAAITHLYEFYFDAIQGGMYIWEIERLHREYGPVVRINPREVHVKDSDYFNVIYAGGKRDKDPMSAPMHAVPTSVLTTVKHHHHKMRRRFIESFFSKLSVTRLDSLIRDRVEILLQRLDQARVRGEVVNLQLAFAALTTDVISEYMYGESLGYLHDEQFRNPIVHATTTTIGWFHYVRFTPGLLRLARLIPLQLLRGDESGLGPFFRLFELSREKAKESLAGPNQGGDSGERTNIFSALTTEDVPASEKSLERLEMEPVVILAAGTDTTAKTLAVAAFYLARSSTALATLRKELSDAFPLSGDRTTWSQQGITATQLEKLPYLTAVIKESLRIAHVISMRSGRVSSQPMIYKDIVIPPGTPVSQSIYFVSMDPEIFPSPETFNPDRWIEAAANGVNLTKYLLIFSSGSRACLGIHLAYAELYHAIAAVTSAFNWELYKTDLEDVRTARDLLFTAPKSGVLSVNATITSKVG